MTEIKNFEQQNTCTLSKSLMDIEAERILTMLDMLCDISQQITQTDVTKTTKIKKPQCGKIQKNENLTEDRAAYMKEYRKKYYETQPDKFKTKVECPICNKTLAKASLFLHNKNIHKTKVENKEENEYIFLDL